MKPLFLFLCLCLLFLLAVSGSAQTWEAAVGELKPSLRIRAKVEGESPVWKSASSLSILAGKAVSLGIDGIEGGDEIRWFQIIPDVSKFYKNANHPWEPSAYQWVGFGKIDYEVRELENLRDQREVNPFAAPLAVRAALYRPDLGSHWFQVRVRRGKTILRSPGIEENDHRNLHPSVFRITRRSGDDFLGHLTGFFNVPGLFGSVPYQCANYIGADCADVQVSAYYQWKGWTGQKDKNVDMLVAEWPRVVTAALSQGRPETEILWDKQIKPGDLIAVKYRGASRFQHVGALFRDADGDGLLSAGDEVIHAGPEALQVSPLSRGGFDGEIAVLRPE